MQKHSQLISRFIIGLFNLLVCTVPFFFTFNTEELFEFNKMMLTYAITICIVFLYCIKMLIHKRILFTKTALDIPIALFVLSQLLSTIFSIHPLTSLGGYYTRFHGGLLSTISYAALYYVFVNTMERKYLKGFFISVLASAGVVSIYAILEHFGFSFSCYLATGGVSGETTCWIQDVKTRVFASFGQPNWLAAYLITLLPLITYSTYAAQKILYKIPAGILTVLFFIAILFTRSRSGFFGMGVGMGLFALLLTLVVVVKKSSLQPKKILKDAGFLFVIFTICTVFLFTIETPFTPKISAFFAKKQPATTTSPATPNPAAPAVNRLEEGGTDSGEIRKIVWTGALRVWKRYPIFGSGVETFGYSYYLDRPVEHNNVSEWDFLYNKAHNEFLNFLATTGIVGFVSYCFLLISFAYITSKRSFVAFKQSRYTASLLYGSLLSGIISLSISNFFGFSTVMVSILLFLFFAVSEIFEAVPKAVSQTTDELDVTQYALLSVISLIAVLLLFKTYNYWTADMAYTRGHILLSQGEIQAGLIEMQIATSKNPEEALFYDTLADQYATYALHYANVGDATAAAELSKEAVAASDLVLQLNPSQLNFYKTRARILINLSQINPQLLEQAKEVLTTATKLAPTDAKLVYNLGLIEVWQDNMQAGMEYFKKALELRPGYDTVRTQLADMYIANKNYPAALEQLEYIVTNINPNDAVARAKIASLSAQLKTTQ
ncbi:O-antigen ligase family protein [Candidatus Woesebacteria bacterium]|nr:O-antigen ligase family protein [Candidatus Woesebacteria bacterium]